MTDLDLNLLRLLVALNRTRHVGRAAEALGMSQSGFSTAFGRLRKQLGDDLFVRTSTGMKPTPRAVNLVESAAPVLELLDSELSGARPFDPAASTVMFRLSMTEVAEVAFLPRLVDAMSVEAPVATLHVTSPISGRLYENLTSGEVDLAIGSFPELDRSKLRRVQLFRHPYACMVRRDHPVVTDGLSLAAYARLRHAVVASPTHSNRGIDRALDALKVERDIAITVVNHLSLPSLISNSDLVSTVPFSTAQYMARSGDLEVLALPFGPVEFTISLYWHQRTDRDPAAMWLRGRMRSLFQTD
jgi:DNA-binding transcriptional LysR family regulator